MWGQGNIVIASGYVTKASPGPPVATVETGKPVSWDMKPITENTTNPAKMLVPQFKIGTRIESLKFNNKVSCWLLIYYFRIFRLGHHQAKLNQTREKRSGRLFQHEKAITIKFWYLILLIFHFKIMEILTVDYCSWSDCSWPY